MEVWTHWTYDIPQVSILCLYAVSHKCLKWGFWNKHMEPISLNVRQQTGSLFSPSPISCVPTQEATSQARLVPPGEDFLDPSRYQPFPPSHLRHNSCCSHCWGLNVQTWVETQYLHVKVLIVAPPLNLQTCHRDVNSILMYRNKCFPSGDESWDSGAYDWWILQPDDKTAVICRLHLNTPSIQDKWEVISFYRMQPFNWDTALDSTWPTVNETES